MAIQTAMNSALAGIQYGFQGLRKVATETATIAATEHTPAATDFTRSLVTLQLHANQIEASVELLEAADEALGTLLDVQA